MSTKDRAEIDAFNAWMSKYEPVERAIIESREKRLTKKLARKAARAEAFGDLCEATEGRAKAWRRQGLSLERQIALSEGDAWSIACLLDYYGGHLTRKIDRMRHQLKRPLYYAAENARRRMLAAERRSVKARRTSNPCPTREQILDAWIHLRDSHEATIRFGSLIEDLACYVDHSLRFDEGGNICGRNGGVKAWLQEHIPALALRYTTVMRYKAAARKLKQIAEIADPTPADAIVGRIAQPGLEHGVRPAKPTRHKGRRLGIGEMTDAAEVAGGATGTTDVTVGAAEVTVGAAEVTVGAAEVTGGATDAAEGASDGHVTNEIMLRTNGAVREMVTGEGNEVVREMATGVVNEVVRELATGRTNEVACELAVELVRARAIWMEVVAGIRANPTALVARLNELVDPARVEDATMLAAWREKYRNEITLRTKRSWWRRLTRRFGVA